MSRTIAVVAISRGMAMTCAWRSLNKKLQRGYSTKNGDLRRRVVAQKRSND
jgi:hypothetical protein